MDNAEDLDFAMSMYNLLKYSNGYAKASVKLWQFRRDEPDDDKLTNSESFRFEWNLTDNTNNAGIVNAEIGLLLKYLCSFCRLLEMLLNDCDLTLNLIWSANCVICEADRVTTFAINDANIYVPVVTFSTQDNAELMQQ